MHQRYRQTDRTDNGAVACTTSGLETKEVVFYRLTRGDSGYHGSTYGMRVCLECWRTAVERLNTSNRFRPTLSDRCLSILSACLSVTLVYCGQTAGWIKMPLGAEVAASAQATLC